jgi:hypothetical protein
MLHTIAQPERAARTIKAAKEAEFEHGASEVGDAAFEQFARQSNVRGISDGSSPYIILGLLRDPCRKGYDHVGILKARELGSRAKWV